MPALRGSARDHVALRGRGVLGSRLRGVRHSNDRLESPRPPEPGARATAVDPAGGGCSGTLRGRGVLDRRPEATDPRPLARSRPPGGWVLRSQSLLVSHPPLANGSTGKGDAIDAILRRSFADRDYSVSARRRAEPGELLFEREQASEQSATQRSLMNVVAKGCHCYGPPHVDLEIKPPGSADEPPVGVAFGKERLP